MTTDDLDPTDIAYVNSLTPDGRMYTGHLTVLTYLDEEGDQQFLVYAQMDREISSVLGLLGWRGEMRVGRVCRSRAPGSRVGTSWRRRRWGRSLSAAMWWRWRRRCSSALEVSG